MESVDCLRAIPTKSSKREDRRPAALASLIAAALLGGCSGEILDRFAEQPSDVTVSCPDGRALRGESQRLDPVELSAAIDDLFGFHVELTPGFPEPVHVEGFETYPEANRIAYADLESIAETADAAAIAAMDHFDALLPCDPASIDEACVSAFVADFAGRAFRGTYEAADGERLLALYRELRAEPDAMDAPAAVAGVISAILQSPSVLYLVERGDGSGRTTLTDREVANRLAFVLWDAPPDDALLAAAEDGRLADAAGRRSEAERMLDDPRARPAVVRFFRDWMGVAGRSFADRVGPELETAFDEELRRLVEEAVFEHGAGCLVSLFGGDTTYVNRALATHYGLDDPPADDATWERVVLPAHLASGLLGRAAVAAAHSDDASTSVVRRGHFVREDVLCDPIGSPPPGAIGMNPVLPEDATVRERIDARAGVDGCSACHSRMDGIGIGMEDVDFIGRYRATYASSGYEVDSAGEIVAFGEAGVTAAFDGTVELAGLVSTSEALASCAPRQWFRYAMGREAGAECNGDTLDEAFAASGGDLREMLLSVIESEGFVARVNEE